MIQGLLQRLFKEMARELLQDLLQEWTSHSEWWFSKDTYDQLIIDKFGHLLDLDFDQEFMKDFNKEIYLAIIILFDQIPRHFYRKECANHIILYFLEKAIHYCDLFWIISSNDLNSLSEEDVCFALLPYRHKGVHFKKIIDIAWKKLKHCQSTQSIQSIQTNGAQIKRFIKATYAKMPLNSIIVNEDYDVIISLSGGSDSMLCLHLFSNNIKLDISCNELNNIIKIVRKTAYRCAVVHINYNNRDSCKDEVEFVKDWAIKMDMPFYERTLWEINRADCMKYGLRELYETYTRNVRFDMYKRVSKDAKVVLGHNKDDVLENIFTNIAKKDFQFLDGMSELSCVDGITFWRPLLKISKDTIVDTCRINHIPHLPNSTPTWSMRGQIRNSVVPCLDKWNPNYVSSLYDLSNVVSSLFGVLELQVDIVVKSRRIPSELARVYPFWKCFFQKIGISVSNKSIYNLIEMLKKNSDCLVQVNKDNKLHFRFDCGCFVLD